MTAKVSIGTITWTCFHVTVGGKQSCVIAPDMFSVYLLTVSLLSKITLNNEKGISTRQRIDGLIDFFVSYDLDN